MLCYAMLCHAIRLYYATLAAVSNTAWPSYYPILHYTCHAILYNAVPSTPRGGLDPRRCFSALVPRSGQRASELPSVDGGGSCSPYLHSPLALKAFACSLSALFYHVACSIARGKPVVRYARVP